MISLSADEVERRFQLLAIPNRFTNEEKAYFATTPVVAGENTISFPTPASNSGLNILNLRNILGTNPRKQPAFFDHPWYLQEDFARVNCGAGWHCLHSTVLPESISRPANYADSLRYRGLALPSAVEVALMLFLHFAGTGAQLLQKKHTWCSDRASMGRQVTVGAFGRSGLFVSGHGPDFTSRGLGICAKLMD